MKNDAHARIEREIAEMRGTCPRITSCHTALRTWFEDGAPRHSLWLDVRWPEAASKVACVIGVESADANP